MELGYLGITYQKADASIRDRVFFTDLTCIAFQETLSQHSISQCMILSTCNRCELYYMYDNPQQCDAVECCFQQQFPSVTEWDFLQKRFGEDAIRFLFRVTCGMESLVLGEDQILGQVRNALDFSRSMGCCGKELNRIVQDAVTCAKHIKATKKLSEIPLSVSYIGIQQVKQQFGIAGRRILVIGSGKMAALALPYLFEYGAEKVTLCSRKTANARALTAHYPQLNIVEYDSRYAQLPHCDIVVSATSAPHTILLAEHLPELNHPVYFLDLAMPRDIDPMIAQKEGCTLINMDSLTQIAARNQKEREQLAAACTEEIEESVTQLLRWLKSSRVDATIHSLQQRCAEISQDSYHYLEHKLDLTEREKKLLKKVLDASLLRMLREPIQELKQVEEEQTQDHYRQLLEQLFRL